MERFVSAPANIPVQVFLVDDEVGVTDALSWLLESVKIPSRAFHSASAFLSALDRFDGPACAVLDLRMPEMSGLELQHRLAEAGHDLPLIFLTAHGDVPAAVNAMQAGAVDFVQKPFNPNAFLASVRRAIQQARERFEARTADRELQRRIAQLSAREVEVFRGLLDGRTSKEIARSLEISPKTVDVHRANVMRKMGAATSAELVRMVGRAPGVSSAARR
jgi:FixJ family two-component response regulator